MIAHSTTAIATKTNHEIVDSINMARSACTRRFLAIIGAIIQGDPPTTGIIVSG